MSGNPDALIPIQYSCKCWVDHLSETESLSSGYVDPPMEKEIDNFPRKYLFHWPEALIFMECIPKGVRMIINLGKLLQVSFECGKLQLVQRDNVLEEDEW